MSSTPLPLSQFLFSVCPLPTEGISGLGTREVTQPCPLTLFSALFRPKTGFPVAQLVKNPPSMQELLVWFLGREDPLEKGRLPTLVFLGFPGDSDGKESTCNVGDLGSVPGLGRSPWRWEWQPILVFLLGEFHGQRSLVGYSPWLYKESDMSDQLTHTYTQNK